MTGLTRRGILGASAASLAPLPAIVASRPSVHPDAELIAVCGEFIACDKQQRAVYDGPGAIDDDDEAAVATAPIFARMDALLDRMQALRAQTAEGIVARAASLAQHSGEWAFSFDYREMATGRLLDYLMRDAATLAGNVPAVRPIAHSDADLIAACAAFNTLERAYRATHVSPEPELDSPADLAAQAERDRIHEEQLPLVAGIVEARAVTPEGMAARAHSLTLWDSELMDGGEGDVGGRLTFAIVRDLLGGSVGA